jgi:hypothetical protein
MNHIGDVNKMVIGGCGHGSIALRSQSEVARELGLTKRQVQIAEKSALRKIRQRYRELLAEQQQGG